MKVKNIFPALGVLLFLIVGLVSCEEDFSQLDSNVIDQSSNIEPDETKSVIAYSRKLLPVQSNNLPIYQLGVYNDPVFGKTTANFLTQLTLGTPNPNFPIEPVIVTSDTGETSELERDFQFRSAVLRIPHFFELEVQDQDSIYTVDSIYGANPINIRVRESDFFLRDLDPASGFEEIQRYFSNEGTTFESNLISGGGIGTIDHTIEGFVPATDQVELITQLGDTLRLEPGLVAELPLDFFQNRIIDREDDEVLLNNNNFKDYLRGLYFEVEEIAGGDNLFYFSTAGANITLNYTFNRIQGGEFEFDDEGEIVRENGTLVLTFADVSVNAFETEVPQEIQDAIANPNVTDGEETLYVKGGEGIFTVVELFGPDNDGNGVADELEELRDQEVLINDASLIFYVDQDKVTGGASEPERIKIFDITNGQILVDYQFDITATEPDPNDAITVHLGRLDRGSDANGDFYKIRLTSHISNLINRDSTNVPLGVSVSQNVLITQFQNVENVQSPGLETYPISSIVAREGTVLHGNLSSNQDKRLKLQLFYTQPE